MLSDRFDAVVFDLDGTLIDSEPDLRAALNLTLAGHGRAAVTRPQVIQMIGDGVPKLVERGFEATGGLPPAPFESLVTEFLGHYEGKAAALSTPFPGALEVLAALQGLGIRLGLRDRRLLRGRRRRRCAPRHQEAGRPAPGRGAGALEGCARARRHDRR